MDQIKIGKFIAEQRKSIGLTQVQLAEKLNITDKAISKWERGIAMPDSALMLELCDILKIKVNELLSGEKIKMENYDKELEKRLVKLVKEKELKDKQMLALEWVIGILSVLIIFIPVILGATLPIQEEWKRLVIIFSGFIPGLFGLIFAIKIEQVAGYYECGVCGHRYIPTFKAVILSQHIGRTRKMKCPKCGKKSWQKRRSTSC